MRILDRVLAILFGFILLAHPDLGLLAILWIIAAFAVVTGILLLFFSTKLYHLKHHPPGDLHHAAGA